MDWIVQLHVMGLFRAGHTWLETTPIQPALSRAERGTIEIDATYRDGLDGLVGFEYAWLLTWLHQIDGAADPPPLRQVPFLLRSQQRRGRILSTPGAPPVHPHRLQPVPIPCLTNAPD